MGQRQVLSTQPTASRDEKLCASDSSSPPQTQPVHGGHNLHAKSADCDAISAVAVGLWSDIVRAASCSLFRCCLHMQVFP